MESHTFFQLLAALALAVGAILQAAVLKAPDVPCDIDVKRAGRKVMILAMACAAAYLFSVVADGRKVDPPMVLFMGLMGLAQVVYGLAKLFPEQFHGSH